MNVRSEVYEPWGNFALAFDPQDCAARVCEYGLVSRFYQCTRKPSVQEDGWGWCKQHAPSAKKARAERSRARFEASLENAPWKVIEILREDLDDSRREVERLQVELDGCRQNRDRLAAHVVAGVGMEEQGD